ncbi:MAG TPA: hypothetical protein VIH24_01190 [Candidatus Limnocylindria bacterium]|jgi:hypothetical protein
MGLIRTLIVAGFGVVQAVLTARVLLDLGVLPTDLPLADLIIPVSDALAAPIMALAEGVGFEAPDVGMGMNPVILTALIGWSLIEMVVLMIVGRGR